MTNHAFLEVGVYIALVLFGIGVVYKIGTWFSAQVGVVDKRVPTGERAAAMLKGALGAIVSGKIFSVLKVLIVDVLFQGRILKDNKDRLVWLMHILIFVGFMGLVIFHALGIFFLPESTITTVTDPSTHAVLKSNVNPVNPWMFLRNLFGCLCILGLILAVVRRSLREDIKTNAMDVYAIIILFVIMGTGFLLESLKMTSYSVFADMVKQYGGYEGNDLKGLEAYWVKEYGLASPNITEEPSEALLQTGETNNTACDSCHKQPSSAFASYAIAKAIRPAAIGMDRAGVHNLVWYIHVIAILFGLSFLAFTKFFHIFSTPASLFVAEVTEGEETPARMATRQAIELDGCSHGGVCRTDCPVRIRRQERIDKMVPYGSVFDYVEHKTGADLGNREITG